MLATSESVTSASWRERGPLAAHYAGVENGLLKAVCPYPRNSPDFARPGERVVAGKWKKKWPNFEFRLEHLGTKGTLIGRRLY